MAHTVIDMLAGTLVGDFGAPWEPEAISGRPTDMERRTFLTLLTATTALVACGPAETPAEPFDDSIPPAAEPIVSEPPASEPPTSLPPATQQAAETTPEPEIPEIVGDDDGVVMALTYVGGFTTREYAFQNPPYVTVTDDGRLLTIGVAEEPAPGSLLLGSQDVRSITPAGIEQLVEAAGAAGLLTNIAYDSVDGLADASTATLQITVGGTTYLHEAYALGIGGDLEGQGGEADPDRTALAEFVEKITGDIESIIAPSELGTPGPWEPEAYQLLAEPAPDLGNFGADATVVDWPAETGVVLADSSTCIEVAADAVGDVLKAADALTFFTEGTVTYQVIARPAYPGSSC